MPRSSFLTQQIISGAESDITLISMVRTNPEHDPSGERPQSFYSSTLVSSPINAGQTSHSHEHDAQSSWYFVLLCLCLRHATPILNSSVTIQYILFAQHRTLSLIMPQTINKKKIMKDHEGSKKRCAKNTKSDMRTTVVQKRMVNRGKYRNGWNDWVWRYNIFQIKKFFLSYYRNDHLSTVHFHFLTRYRQQRWSIKHDRRKQQWYGGRTSQENKPTWAATAQDTARLRGRCEENATGKNQR